MDTPTEAVVESLEALIEGFKSGRAVLLGTSEVSTLEHLDMRTIGRNNPPLLQYTKIHVELDIRMEERP